MRGTCLRLFIISTSTSYVMIHFSEINISKNTITVGAIIT